MPTYGDSKKATSAISTLIVHFEEHSLLPNVKNHFDSNWAIEDVAEYFDRKSLLQRRITNFLSELFTVMTFIDISISSLIANCSFPEI